MKIKHLLGIILFTLFIFSTCTSDFTNQTIKKVYMISFLDSFEDGVIVDDEWLECSAGITCYADNTIVTDGNYSARLEGGDSSDDRGIYQSFSDGLAPSSIGFYVRSSSTSNNDCYFVLYSSVSPDPAKKITMFYLDSSARINVIPEIGVQSYTQSTWYHVIFKNIDWKNYKFDLWINNVEVQSDIAFMNSASLLKCMHIYNYSSGSVSWYDKIIMN